MEYHCGVDWISVGYKEAEDFRRKIKLHEKKFVFDVRLRENEYLMTSPG